MPGLPTGTVTFLFTDIEGSTTLLQRLGDRPYAEVLEEHRRLLRDAFAEGHGQEVDTQGDAFLVAFSRARDGLATAVAAQRALAKYPWPDGAVLRVRMGLHTGEPLSGGSGYVGIDVHRAARIAVAGHGGQILVSDVTRGLVAGNLPEGVSLRDLGEHRLKDLSHPQRLFEVVAAGAPADFPPLRSPAVLPNNLPRQLTSFVGREKETTEVKRLLATACLVTLTGPGGAGKTRLALHVAADVLSKYSDGVWFVDLAPLADPALVARAIASALDTPEQADRPLHETLARHLRMKSLLLLLDNCERVISACRDLADGLLRACSSLRILATSQEALGVDGEVIYPLEPLGIFDLRRPPVLSKIIECEAIRLFTERAALSQGTFTLTEDNALAVALICHRLDGIPLAVELAAAQTKVLSVDQIAARLDDRFRLLSSRTRKALPRHQTLRAAMDWSYDLLPEQERTLFRRLSVFAGGWTLETAEAVCSGNGIQPGEVLDLLASLRDRSLVAIDTGSREARYRLLETVRQYGRDKLAETGEAGEMRRRHKDWYLSLAEQAGPKLRGPEQRAWLERLETEHDNLRAALEYIWAENDGAEAALRLVAGLWWFWFVRGHWNEGTQWVERVLSRSSGAPSPAQAEVLEAAFSWALHRGDHGHAAMIAQALESTSQRLGDTRSAANSFFLSGMVAKGQGDHPRAAALLERGLALFRDLGDKWGMAVSLSNLASLARIRGDYTLARSLYEESVPLRREAGDDRGLGISLLFLGDVLLHQGDDEKADSLFRESLGSFRKIGFRHGTGWALDSMARLAVIKHEPERAARLFGAEEALRELIGYEYPSIRQTDYEQLVTSVRRALGDAAFSDAWTEGRSMTWEQAVEYALGTPESPSALG